MFRTALIVPLLSATLLAGCDLFGDSAEKLAAAREADGRAIGGACRHANRAIEDCYALNKKADKASVFAGWRDMNDYMRENKIEPVAPQLLPASGSRAAKADKADKAEKIERTEAKVEPKPEGEAAEAVLPVDKKPAKATAKPRDGES